MWLATSKREAQMICNLIHPTEIILNKFKIGGVENFTSYLDEKVKVYLLYCAASHSFDDCQLGFIDG
jgi:hypothetical protein